jgi:microcompartment protein CcmL/EutN
MNDKTYPEALALFDIDGVARAMGCHDAALKRAPVEVMACTPVSAGRAVLVFGGQIAAVEESLAAVDEKLGSRLIDRLYLPQVHPKVIDALRAQRHESYVESLAIFELSNVASSVEAADQAVKNAQVTIGRLHVATGFGGKGYFTLWGDQSDVEAGVEIVKICAAQRLVDVELIARPHEDLALAAFKRPWPLDPCAP